MTPETNCLAANCNTLVSGQVFNIAEIKIESVVKPDSVSDDVGRKAVTFVCIRIAMLLVLLVNLTKTDFLFDD
jgi:hypothetical protein